MPHIAELIAVGTELLLGNIANTDAQMISQGLSELGIHVYYHTVVGDNPARLRSAVEIARRRADILITTGGLGPTCDDLTKQTLAQHLQLLPAPPPRQAHDGEQPPAGHAAGGLHHLCKRLGHRPRLRL